MRSLCNLRQEKEVAPAEVGAARDPYVRAAPPLADYGDQKAALAFEKSLPLREHALSARARGRAHEAQGIRLHADLVLEVVGKLLDSGPVTPFADHERAIELGQLGQG
jgi:hypothetical protein